MPPKNIKLTMEYKGTAYAGWQIQTELKTIQGEITDAIYKTTRQRVSVTGASRTDAGVHALGQVANFIIDHYLAPPKYKEALNFYLSEDIRIKEACEVGIDFNARRDAVSKRYRYLISRQQSAIYRDLRWEYPIELDFQHLKLAAELVEGTHDFAPFCVVASRQTNNICRVELAKWRQVGPLLVFEIRGNRFLHGMVRSLVGAMVNMATVEKDNNPQNLTLERFADIIESSTDERVVFTAPPQGLYLVSVQYKKGSTA
ncbi:MAG: tRNA pseudouridine(38-40) synthase TruA [Candidatus Zixiibacteriota bacterium]